MFPSFDRFAEVLRTRKGIHTSAQLCEVLLQETGVALLPGSAFLRPPHELTARLSYCNFDGERALQAAREVRTEEGLGDDFVKRHLPETEVALQALEGWLAALQ